MFFKRNFNKPAPPMGIRIGPQKETKDDNAIILDQINDLADIYGYSFTQINGQRIFGKKLNGNETECPGVECEIHIGNIPIGWEMNVLWFLLNFGHLHEMRFLYSFDGRFKGFAFAKFESPEKATTALGILLYFPLPKGDMLFPTKSRDNTRVVVLNMFWKYFRADKVKSILVCLEIAGIKSILVNKQNVFGKFSFIVEFSTHREAALGRRVLMAKKMEWSPKVVVDWLWRQSPDTDALVKYSWSPACLGKGHQPHVEYIF